MDDSLCILRPFKVIIQNLKLTQFVDCPEIKNCRMLRFLFERVQIKDQNSTVLIDTRMAFYNTRSEGAWAQCVRVSIYLAWAASYGCIKKPVKAGL
jgi:hypothetical protein